MNNRTWSVVLMLLITTALIKGLAAALHSKISDVHALAFSPDGTYVVAGHTSGEITTWDPLTGKRLTLIRTKDWGLEKVAVSHDGRWFATFHREGNEAGRVRVWEAATGLQVGHLEDCYPQSSVTFHPNRPLLAWMTADHSIAFWDTMTRKEVRRLAVRRGRATDLEFSPDGHHLGLGLIESAGNPSLTDAVVLWNIEDDKAEAVFKGLSSFSWDLAFSSKGDRIGAVNGEAFRVWDVSTKRVILAVDSLPVAQWSISFSVDGSRVAVAMWGSLMREYDLTEGRVTREWKRSPGTQETYRTVRHDPLGRFLAHSLGMRVVFVPLQP